MSTKQENSEKDNDKPSQSTKDRILQSAKLLLASRGPNAMTVRDIAEDSGVNIASINYHFGSRDALICEALLAVIGPVNIRRQEMLQAAKEQFGAFALPLPVIMDAMMRPLVDSEKSAEGSRLFVRMEQHLRADPSSSFTQFVTERFDRYAQLFISELKRSLPHLSIAEAVWRYEFARGAGLHLLANMEPQSTKFKALTSDYGIIQTQHQEVILRAILANVLGGLASPSIGLDIFLLAPKIDKGEGSA
jgi:AcrR family transcriptional regulator